MNASAKKEKLRNRGLSGRLHRWVKDEHAVGLDVHDGHIVAAHFTKHNSGLLLNALAVETYNPALSEKELAHCIREFWKKNKLPTRTVCTSLHTPSLISRSFSYTNVLPDELHRVLTLEAEEALQLPLERIALSWHLNPSSSENKKEISGVLIAAPRKTVLQHIKLMQAAGLYPVNVEIDSSAAINLYDFLNKNTEPAPVCLVNLTSHMASVVILSDGSVWPRIVYSGSETGWQDNLDYLIENIDGALLHYQLKTTGDPVSKLLLTGNALQNKAMERIAEAMTVPAERWNLTSEKNMSRLLHSKSVDFPEEIDAFNLITGLGLGLRYPKRGH
ncbi:MAG: pilus assembly protein PilM [Verrucomicrobia bacterium]|nr:pilus assembly protein PilM [Verrucomicrobiota bacterium]